MEKTMPAVTPSRNFFAMPRNPPPSSTLSACWVRKNPEGCSKYTAAALIGLPKSSTRSRKPPAGRLSFQDLSMRFRALASRWLTIFATNILLPTIPAMPEKTGPFAPSASMPLRLEPIRNFRSAPAPVTMPQRQTLLLVSPPASNNIWAITFRGSRLDEKAGACTPCQCCSRADGARITQPSLRPDFGEETGPPQELHSEVIGDARSHIGQSATRPQVHAPGNRRACGKDGDVLTRVIGRWTSGVTAMIGGENEDIASFQATQKDGDESIQGFQSFSVTSQVKPMAIEHVKINEIGEDQSSRLLGNCRRRAFQRLLVVLSGQAPSKSAV